MARSFKRPIGVFKSYFEYGTFIGAAQHLLGLYKIGGTEYLAQLSAETNEKLRRMEHNPKGFCVQLPHHTPISIPENEVRELTPSLRKMQPKLERLYRREAREAANMGALVLAHAAFDTLLGSLIYQRVRIDEQAYRFVSEKVAEKQIRVKEAIKLSKSKIERGLVEQWLQGLSRLSILDKLDILAKIDLGRSEIYKNTEISNRLSVIDAARNDVVHEFRSKHRKIDVALQVQFLEELGINLSLILGFPPFERIHGSTIKVNRKRPRG